MEDFEIAALWLMLLTYFMMEQESNDFLMMVGIALESERNKVVKIQNFYEVTVPQMQPRYFRRYFRMNIETMANVVHYTLKSPLLQDVPENRRLPLEKKVAMTAAYLGSKNTTMQLSYLFDVSEETFLRSTDLIIDAWIDNIHQIIAWPSRRELPLIAGEFDKIGRCFPNTIGAIDDMHLEIELTEERDNYESYCNYKQWYSVHLQAVATYDLRFIHVFAGWPGRSHDAGVFKQSPLYTRLKGFLHDPNRLILDSFHIVGDTAFPCCQQMLTPFKRSRNRHLSAVQRRYNKNLSSKRQNVERAFSLLIRRFPRLQRLNQKSLSKKIKVILACCILHNICIMERDNIEFYMDKAVQRQFPRRHLYGNQPLMNPTNSGRGQFKRQQFARYINRLSRTN